MLVRSIIVSTLWLCGLAPFSMAAAQDSWAGKTVRIVLPSGPGGEYGQYAQLVAAHIGRHVPGHPAVVVQPMPGAGGLASLNWLANIAPKDGTALTLVAVNVVQDGLFSDQSKYDPAKFQWIGRVASLLQAGVVRSSSGVRNLSDARNKALVAGGIGPTNPTAFNARILNEFAGTKFRIVAGYTGTAEVELAWQKGEVDVWTTSWDTVRLKYPQEVARGEIIPIYAYAMSRVGDLRDVPILTEFGRNDAERAFLKIYTIATEIGRAIAAPPGMPAAQVDIWRKAFDAMIADPEFLDAVQKGNVRFEPMNGAALAHSVAEVFALPTESIAQAKKVYDDLVARPQ